MKKITIIGHGSIGRRHGLCLEKLGFDVSFVSRRENDHPYFFRTLNLNLQDFCPDAIFICTETFDHLEQLKELKKLEFAGKIFVEKPLFSSCYDFSPLDENQVYVLYNLRWHPALLKLREELHGQKVIQAIAYCGQYLPDWRPDRDYTQTYSAFSEQGGGVLRDLSHEIDYCHWLFSPFKSFSALGGKLSSLQIDSEDVFSIQGFTHKGVHLNIHLNYLDRKARRFMLVTTQEHSYELDFIQATLSRDGSVVEKYKDFDTYINQAQAIKLKQFDHLCSFREGVKILEVIEKSQNSSINKKWVEL